MRLGVLLGLIGAGALGIDQNATSLGLFTGGIVVFLSGVVGYLWNEE